MGYFTVFSLGANSHDDTQGKIAFKITVDFAGVRRKIFKKKLILFSLRHFCTMNHEGLHGFNVKHTHRNSTPLDDPNYKYVFPNTDYDKSHSANKFMRTEI